MDRTLIGLLVGLGMGAILLGPVWVQAEGEVPLPESPVMEAESGNGMDGESGGETGDGTDPMNELDDEASGPGGSERVTQKLAQQFDVEADQITDLRDAGLGYGEVSHTLRLADTLPGGITEENVSLILEMRQEEGMGWGVIAQELDVKLGHVAGRGHTAPVVPDPGTTDPSMDAPESPVISSTSTISAQQAGRGGGGVGGFGRQHGGRGHGMGQAKGVTHASGALATPGSHGGGHGAGGIGGGLPGGGGLGGTRGKSGSARGHNR